MFAFPEIQRPTFAIELIRENMRNLREFAPSYSNLSKITENCVTLRQQNETK